MSHYYTENTDVESNPKEITCNILGEEFKFITDNGVFSKDYLDYATGLLLKNLVIKEEVNSVLDVGCGYGPIGIIINKMYAKKVVMVDVNERALNLAKQNIIKNKVEAKVIKSDCLDCVGDSFDMIITNPPIRAGKEVVYKIFEQSFVKLNALGELWIIIQYNHGAPSAVNKLKTLFDNVEIVYKKKGFYIVKCIK